MSQQEDARTEFYKIYRKEAEEYDKEFMKKYDEDLNTTLIFVSLPRCPNTCAKFDDRPVCFPPWLPRSSSWSIRSSSQT